MSFDFDTVPDRRFTGSYKWMCAEPGAEFEGAFPMSTADMEWSAPPAVKTACSEWALKGFYGYTEGRGEYLRAVCDFMRRRHDFDVNPDWVVTTYGIVSAINTAVRAFTKEGDGIIIQKPVYYPFISAVENNGRTLVNNALVRDIDGFYRMNFDELERLAADKQNKMLILCSPHNPTGRVWTEEELKRLAEICIKNNLILVSDEIHFDITAKKHTVIINTCPEIADRVIICTAASKSFNIAGLGTSNIIIPDDCLRNTFRRRIAMDGYSCINSFAYPATVAAYTECDLWLDEMNKKLNENFLSVEKFLSEKLPQIKITPREGTYLAWLDVSALGIDDRDINRWCYDNLGITVNNGGWFGAEGRGFVRINLAVPKAVLGGIADRALKIKI